LLPFIFILSIKNTHIKTYLVALWFLASLSVQAQKAQLIETLKFKEFFGGVIVVTAQLNNGSDSLNFILDTGSSGVSLDSTTANILQIKQQPTDTILKGIGGANKINYAFNQSLKLGKVKIDSLNFFINDYSLLASAYGERIDGIIGYSVLSKFIFEINFDSETIKLYKPGSFKYSSAGKLINTNFYKIPFYPVEIRDNAKTKNYFYLDSGAGLNMLFSEDYVTDNKLLHSWRKPIVTQVQGLGGKRQLKLTVVKRVKFASYTFINVPVNIFNDVDSILPYPGICGVLGNDIMRRFNIVINYPAKQMHFVPNTHFDDAFNYAYTGMFLYQHGADIIIDDVLANSPAEKAGILSGDKVIGVDNNFSGNINQYEKILQQVRTPVKLVIMRNEKAKIIEIVPKSIL
jgi:Aspartyl protease/PDZ domain